MQSLIRLEFGDRVLLRHERHEAGPEIPLAGAFPAARQSFRPDLLLLLPPTGGPCDAEALLTSPPGASAGAPMVVVTDREEPAILQRLLDLGVSDFLVPPLRPLDVRLRLRRLLTIHQKEVVEFARTRQRVGLARLIGESPAWLAQVRKLPLLAECDATVLITGETGTGKELCARALHYLSNRSCR